MDTGRFDALTRVLATAGTRRRAVAGLAAAAAAVVLGDGAVSAAKCSRGKKRCGKKCISRKACCVKGKQIPEGGEYRQCGICIGGNVVKDPVHIHDWNATILHLLGIDHERLTFKFQGRDYRLTDVHGNVVKGLLA